MNTATIRELNAINRRFYTITASDFDQTRATPWPGWLTLAAHLGQVGSVLDVGCGNGRFGVFLAESDHPPTYYHGVDSNTALLDSARNAMSAHPQITTQLETRDIIEQPLDTGLYDLVVAFGLLHHIPGRAHREAFVRGLRERVAPGGWLAFACWRFYNDERLRSRVVPWPVDLAGRVEAGDYLLDWRRGERALRYCHHVDEAEHDALVTATGLTEITRYFADGGSGRLNCYSLLNRTNAM